MNLSDQLIQGDYSLQLPHGIAKGIYMLTLQGEGQRFSKRIILQ